MAEHPNPRSPDDSALDRLLERLPRRIAVAELHEARQETETMRRVLRHRPRPLGTAVRAVMAAALALALFSAGTITGRQDRFGPLDLEAVVAAAPALTAGEREVLVQRLGSAYLRALLAAISPSPDTRGDLRRRLDEPVWTVVHEAARLVAGEPFPREALPGQACTIPDPGSPLARLISF